VLDRDGASVFMVRVENQVITSEDHVLIVLSVSVDVLHPQGI
jgi:hypothetical protein